MIIVSMPIVKGVSLNNSPNHFQQMANQICAGLKSRGLDVIYRNIFEEMPPFDSRKDFYICDWTRMPSVEIPRERIIYLDNCNFNYQNKDGRYTKYGLDINTNTSPPLTDWCRDKLKGLRGAVFLSNDVALGQIAGQHPDIMECYNWWLTNLGSRLKVTPHPINKPIWTQYFKPEIWGPQLLVYHKGGKNSFEYIQLLNKLGYREGYEYCVTRYIDKENSDILRNLNLQFHSVVNCSFSETGPINMIEYQCQGLLVIGMEDWWTGYGEPRTIWTYDPNRKDEMAQNIKWLLNRNNTEEIRITRNRIHSEQIARKDNEWSYVIDKLIEIMTD